MKKTSLIQQYIYKIIFGGLLFLVILVLAFSFLKDNPSLFGTSAPENLSQDTQTLLEESQEKLTKAQELVSRKDSTEEDQQQALTLLQDALKSAQQATEKEPAKAETWVFLSQVYRQLAGIDKALLTRAEEAMTKAITLQPENHKLYIELGSLYSQQQAYDKAESTLRKALTLAQTDPQVYFNLGFVTKKQGKKEDAIWAYTEAKKRLEEGNPRLGIIEKELQELNK